MKLSFMFISLYILQIVDYLFIVYMFLQLFRFVDNLSHTYLFVLFLMFFLYIIYEYDIKFNGSASLIVALQGQIIDYGAIRGIV